MSSQVMVILGSQPSCFPPRGIDLLREQSQYCSTNTVQCTAESPQEGLSYFVDSSACQPSTISIGSVEPCPTEEPSQMLESSQPGTCHPGGHTNYAKAGSHSSGCLFPSLHLSRHGQPPHPASGPPLMGVQISWPST
uniref:Uncharacterized protein n=1 Tax=Micrurus spixii TaxID=129469 RepID=A0A2D4LBR6_9SAUR